MSKPRNQESGSVVCKKCQMSHRGRHTHAWDKIEPWLPIKYTVDTCQTTMKSSCEQYTMELHLEIKKIYIESIHLPESDLA
jgi:hypothetical protein